MGIKMVMATETLRNLPLEASLFLISYFKTVVSVLDPLLYFNYLAFKLFLGCAYSDSE